MTAPNLLFVFTDQQRADALGVVSPWLQTPAMDRLAREGVRFRRCVTQSPGCIPARVALMTGLHPHNTGVWSNRPFTLPATAKTWVRNIRDAGYRTAMIGKTHLHPQGGDLRDRAPLVQSWGFDDVVEIAGPHGNGHCRSALTDAWEAAGVLDAYVADLASRGGDAHFTIRPSPVGLDLHYDSFIGRTAVDWIEKQEPDTPWFCWVGFAGPHEPWDAPEPYASLYSIDDVPEPLPPIVDEATTRPEGQLLDERMRNDTRRMASLGPDDILALRAAYAAKVSLIDHHVGNLLAAVEARGELDRTVVVLSSDHGEMNGDHGLMHKSSFLEPAVTVPLVVRAPGVGPRVVDAPVELNDVGATLAELAGRRVEFQQWAQSVWPLVEGRSDSRREFAVSEQRGELLLTDRRWKVALNRSAEVYLCVDLEDDPQERRNLAGSDGTRQVEGALRDLALRNLLATQLNEDWH